jgi:ferredoxin-NADP reductase
MAISPSGAAQPEARRDHFHPLRVLRVVRETADASTIVLEVPEDLRDLFHYDAGQYCTFRVWLDGEAVERCYSMSSAPGIDAELQVTVKRVPDGLVSNWINDAIAAGDPLETARPMGRFRLAGEGDLVAFAAGSGITPVFSLIKTALASSSRRVQLLYANRDAESVIFDEPLRALAQQHEDRFQLVHHFDADDGFVTAADVEALAGASAGGEFYLCGPGPFMDLVETTLLADGVDAGRIHVERFETLATPEPADEVVDEPSGTTEVVIELDGETRTAEYRSGTTILQTARQVGLAPPFSCEAGNCATCMAQLVEGTARMHANNALTDDEVAGGWVLTCQAVPTSPSVHVVYGYGD